MAYLPKTFPLRRFYRRRVAAGQVSDARRDAIAAVDNPLHDAAARLGELHEVLVERFDLRTMMREFVALGDLVVAVDAAIEDDPCQRVTHAEPP